MTRQEIDRAIDGLEREFSMSKPNDSRTFTHLAERLSGLGLSRELAMRRAREWKPGSYAAYQRELAAGCAPQLLMREDYQRRLEAAVRSGGRLN